MTLNKMKRLLLLLSVFAFTVSAFAQAGKGGDGKITVADYGQLPTSTYSSLPTCSSANDGKLYRVTDTNKDVYKCNGAAATWVSQNGGVYNAADFSASSSTGGISEAVTAIGSASATLVISANITLSAAATVPANISVQIRGGIITLGNYDLTIRGDLNAPVRQVFNLSGTGRVYFQGSSTTPGNTVSVYPEWFQTSSATDWYNAIQWAITSVTKTGEVIFTASAYSLGSNTLTIPVTNGSKEAGLKLRARTPGQAVVISSSGVVANVGDGVTSVYNLTVSGLTFTSTANTAVKILSSGSSIVFSDCFFITNNSSYSSLEITGGLIGSLFERCYFYGTNSNTVPLLYIHTQDFNVNILRQLTFGQSATYQLKLDNTSATSFCLDNLFEQLIFEIPNGGAMYLGGVSSTTVTHAVVYDLTTEPTADLFVITSGSGGLTSRGTRFINVGRRGGGWANASKYDVNWRGPGLLLDCNGTSGGNGSLRINLNSESPVVINSSGYAIYTASDGAMMLDAAGVIAGGGIAAYSLWGDTRLIVSNGAPQGSITAPKGSIYIQHDGALGKLVYLKGSGSGNTGWTPIVSAENTLGYTAQTANYSAASSDYLIDCTTNSFTVTLPTAVGVTGKIYVIKNSGSGTITIATTSSQTIDGASPGTILAGKQIMVQSDGANWKRIIPNTGAVLDAAQTWSATQTFTNGIFSSQTATTVPYLDASKQLTSSSVTPTELGYVSGVTSAIQTQFSGKASTALDNLASVAINAALIPATAAGLDFGSTAKPWKEIWFAGSSGTPGTNQFKLTGASTSGVRTITLPDASITVTGSASGLTSGRVPYATTGGLLTDSANLTWDSANSRLLLGLAGANNSALNVNVAGEGMVTLYNSTSTKYLTFGIGSGGNHGNGNLFFDGNANPSVANQYFQVSTGGTLVLGNATNGATIVPSRTDGTFNVNGNIATSRADTQLTFGQQQGSNQATSGTGIHGNFSAGFSPTSGTATYAFVQATSTVNQTGGASGITRNFFSNPTLTSAADFRHFEIATTAASAGTNQTGIAVGALSGATNNTHLLLGTTSIPSGTYGAYIVSSATGAIPLLVKLAASQTADALQILDSSSTALFKVSSAGVISWAANTRQTFAPGATVAGLNVGSVSSDPSTPTNGDLWYNSTSNALKAYINGAAVSLGAGGGGSPGGSTTQVQYNSSGSFAGAAGFTFDGTAAVTLGVAGTSVGAVKFKNATSGTVTLSPVTGPLGTVTLSLPAVTDQLAVLGTQQTFTAPQIFGSNSRTFGTGQYFSIQIPQDTGITANTESIGVWVIPNTRAWADGTTTLQREVVFGAPTYAKTTSAATFTTAVNVDIADPIPATGVTFGSFYGLRANNVLFTGVIKAGSTPTLLTDVSGKILSAALNTVAVAQGGTGSNSAGITAFNNITGYTASGATGTTSTNLVFSNGPTLVSPVISSISNTGTLTLPTSTDTLVGRATTDTLTNKTLTSPVLGNASFRGNTYQKNAKAVVEYFAASATAATGTIDLDVETQSFLYYTSNASGNWTINLKASTTTMGSLLPSLNDALTCTFCATQGPTPYYNTTVQVEGTTTGVTTKWLGGAPTAGNAGGIDCYTYTLLRSASGYTVLASMAQWK